METIIFFVGQGLGFYLSFSYSLMLLLMIVVFLLIFNAAAKSGEPLESNQTIGLAILCVIYVIFSPLAIPLTGLLLFEG